MRLGEALSWNVDLQHGRQSADAHVRLHTPWTVASRSYGEVDAEVVDDKAADRAVRSQIGSGGLSWRFAVSQSVNPRRGNSCIAG